MKINRFMAAASVMACAAGLASAGSFYSVAPSSDGPSAVFGVSADGSVATGIVNGSVYRWTAADGATVISDSSYFHTFTSAISADGNTIVSAVAGDDGLFSAARWTQSNGWQNLGGIPGQSAPDGEELSTAWGVNHDGSTVVGLGWHTNYRAEAISWTQSTGVVGLGKPSSGSSRASAISADTSTIVGFYENPDTGERRAARWVNGGGPDLFMGETSVGEAMAATSDGSRIVGGGIISDFNQHAFIYSDTEGTIDLGILQDSGFGFDQSVATGISDTGVVIGWSGDLFFGSPEAFVWTEAGGMVRIGEYLAGYGVIVPSNLLIITATAISADGTTIGGQAVDLDTFAYTGWIATVPAPATAMLWGGAMVLGGVRRRR